jgi:aryl-alcohol dehydrogenase-like predicted oxidoreductase
MQTREIGNDTVGRVTVGAVGLGLMTFDQTGAQPRQQLLDTVSAALEAGVTLFDTADAYGAGDESGAGAQGQNERLIASLLDELGVRDRVLLATKGGHVRTADGGWDVDSSATHLKEAVDASLQRLGVEQLSLWQHHRPDPKVPYDEVIATLKEIADSGKVAHVGLSNANPQQIRDAHAVLGDALVSVQNQFSPKFRSSKPEIDVCDELGIAFLPWSPLGGISGAAELGDKFAAFEEVAREHDVSPQRVCLAWMLATSPVVIPIPGSSRPETARDSAAAADLMLTADEKAAIDAAVGVS